MTGMWRQSQLRPLTSLDQILPERLS